MALLDRLAGGVLLAASASGPGLVLSLFDGKAELARVSGDLVAGLGDRLRGLDRFSRTQRLLAAHAVMAVAAYFEAVAGAVPGAAREFRLIASEQVALAGGQHPGGRGLRDVAETMLQSAVPAPAPQWPYEVALEAMRGFYEGLSDAVLRFVSGLAAWDQLDGSSRQRLTDLVSNNVPGAAVTRYEEGFRRLAVDCPEVAFWANQVDHQATRDQLRQLNTGLAGLERLLTDIGGGRAADDRRAELSRVYRAALDRPVLDTRDAPAGVRLPLLRDGYINPDYRVADVEDGRLANESWWTEQPVRDDLQGFLLGYLTAAQATEAPLMILGQPGSGKSLLSRILVGRLPAADFLAVRVPLREVSAEADLQSQIEYGIRTATGESLTWPQLTRGADGALPVVVLDGFDELLQATGVSQSDYLQKIARFQEREADRGTPTAVVVTSRTAVADRARPVSGLVVIRLEPFRTEQVQRWLATWNDLNAPLLADRGLHPLPQHAVLRHAELAAQPLLLLMLALYDADHNALQQEDASLREAQLYEKLLTRFAEREVRKAGPGQPDHLLARAVDRELLRLSVVAFAMFNRRRQWVTASELDADLESLLPVSQPPPPVPTGFQATMTAAEVTVGRFFFVHEARANRSDGLLSTYEFLHATFGEYLIARAVSRELRDLAEDAARDAARSRPAVIDDSFLYALMSHAALTTRGNAVAFLTDLLDGPDWGHLRPTTRRILITLFHDALHARRASRFDSYQPAHLPVPAQHAAWSVNLLLMTVLVGGEVAASELFPAANDVKVEWHKIALLWRSQLSPEGWTGMINTVDADRHWQDGHRELHIRPASAQPDLTIDPNWTDEHPDGGEERRIWLGWLAGEADAIRRQERFLCGHYEDLLLHAIQPLAEQLGPSLGAFAVLDEAHSVSAAHALLALWLSNGNNTDAERLLTAYTTCLKAATQTFLPSDEEIRRRYTIAVLHNLTADLPRLPHDGIRTAITAAINISDKGELLWELVQELLPELLPTDHAPPSASHDDLHG